MQNILDTIVEQHEEMKGLFKTATSSNSSKEERIDAFNEIAASLEAHAGSEERHLYAHVWMNDDGIERSRHASHEHEEASEQIKKLKDLDPKGEAFLKHLKELSESVHHHMEEEEGEYFDLCRKVLSEEKLQELNNLFLKDYSKLKKQHAKETVAA